MISKENQLELIFDIQSKPLLLISNYNIIKSE